MKRNKCLLKHWKNVEIELQVEPDVGAILSSDEISLCLEVEFERILGVLSIHKKDTIIKL